MLAFMERGHWEQHIRRSRIFYKKKHGIMLQAIEQHFGNRAKVVGQGAGLHIVLELAEGLKDEAVFIEQARQRVFLPADAKPHIVAFLPEPELY